MKTILCFMILYIYLKRYMRLKWLFNDIKCTIVTIHVWRRPRCVSMAVPHLDNESLSVLH